MFDFISSKKNYRLHKRNNDLFYLVLPQGAEIKPESPV